MATNSTANVHAGKPKIGGSVFVAPLGTALPTDSTTALNNAFENCGYISEDGVEPEITRSSDPKKAWGGDTVYDAQTDYQEKYKTTFIESTNVQALKTVFGSNNVSGTYATGLSISRDSKELPYQSWVIEMVTRDGGTRRVVIPNGKVTEIGSYSYKDDELIGYPVTISANPDSSGKYSYEYVKQASS